MYQGYIDIVSARSRFDSYSEGLDSKIVEEYKKCYGPRIECVNGRAVMHIRTLLSNLANLSDEAIEANLFSMVSEGLKWECASCESYLPKDLKVEQGKMLASKYLVKPNDSEWEFTVVAKSRTQAGAFVQEHGQFNVTRCDIAELAGTYGCYSQLGVIKSECN